MSHPDEEPTTDAAALATKAAAVAGALFTITALALSGTRAATSVFVGAAIAVANLAAMRAIIRALIQPPPDADGEAPDHADDESHARKGRRGGAAWGIFAVLKLVFLFGGIWFLLTRELVAPMPLLIGYGALPVGIVAGALWPTRKGR